MFDFAILVDSPIPYLPPGQKPSWAAEMVGKWWWIGSDHQTGTSPEKWQHGKRWVDIFFWRGTYWKFTTLDTAWWCVVSPKFCDSHIGHIFCNDTTHEMIEKTSFWSRRIIFCRVCHSVRTLGERTLWQRKLRKLILLPFWFWLLKAAPNLGTVGWCGNSF